MGIGCWMLDTGNWMEIGWLKVEGIGYKVEGIRKRRTAHGRRFRLDSYQFSADADKEKL